MDDFKEIIGSGGFGLIVKHTSKPVVAKFLYEAGCKDASVEYNYHKDIYNVFARIKDPRYSQLCVPEPYGFSNEDVIAFGKYFSCYYMMALLEKLDDNGLYHIIKDSMKKSVDKIIGRRYGEPVSDENPSRGFFASYSYIRDNLLPSFNSSIKGGLSSISNIIRYIGFSYGVIAFLAEYNPKDVEYTLGRGADGRLCFCVLDFGMVHKLTFLPDAISPAQYEKQLVAIKDLLVTNFEIDVYFPDEESTLDYFLSGVEDAVSLVSVTDPAYKEKMHIFEMMVKEIRESFE